MVHSVRFAVLRKRDHPVVHPKIEFGFQNLLTKTDRVDMIVVEGVVSIFSRKVCVNKT